MRVSAIGDVIKVWVWALGSLVIGLWFTPIAYNGGKALSELSVSKDFNGFVNELAAWSGAAGLEDFFKVCWPASAIILLLPMVEWLRLGNSQREKKPWSIRLPYLATSYGGGQEIKPNRRGPLQAVTGFLMTFGCFVLIGYAMVKAGSFRWSADAQAWKENLIFDIGWALLVAVVIEIFFRCVVLGIFLRAMKISAAIALAAVMFAGIQFLIAGFGEAEAFDGETLSAIHLTGILLGGGEPITRFVVVFLPWFAFGCVLGWARSRTASVWLPAGLLMGWLLADRLFEKATTVMEIPNKVSGYFSAGSIQTGIIPLVGVLAIGVIVHLFTQTHAREREALD